MLLKKVKQTPHVLILLILTTFLLTSCSTTPKSVIYTPKPVERPELILPETKTLNMRNVDFIVMTRENVEEEFAKLEKDGKAIVIFGLDAEDYEKLSFNIADILELLDQQQSVIVAYREYYEEADKTLEEINLQSEIEIEVDEEGGFLSNFLK
jgi:uncharacterized lipoprotein YajG